MIAATTAYLCTTEERGTMQVGDKVEGIIYLPEKPIDS